jgi:amidase
MHKLLFLLILVPILVVPKESHGQNAQEQARFNPVVSGRWSVSEDFYGTSVNFSMKLTQDGDKLTGNFQGNPLDGTLEGNAIKFVAKGEQGGTLECNGTVQDNTISGTLVFANTNNPESANSHSFTATLVPQRRQGTPQRHEFIPTSFYREFSASNKPVLTVSPGDTIHTTTVDAGGTDEKGVTRVLGGNPQTGPFYIETAAPGDTLVVHLTRLRLNRNWAISDDALVDRGLDRSLAVTMKDNGKPVRWHLDTQRGVATPEKPGEHLAKYSVPLRPMLGCIAVARPKSAAGLGTGDSADIGGNMDFNEIIEGATVFLPVYVPGALLYVGDGHAAQGDGELNGNALETSMDVELMVEVIPEKRPVGPRVESATEIMAMGLSGSLDDAFRAATANMAQWLTDDFKLTPSEVAEVLGTSAQYKVSEVADRNAGIVLKISKERLQPFMPAK